MPPGEVVKGAIQSLDGVDGGTVQVFGAEPSEGWPRLQRRVDAHHR
jgi:hypothetical protein